MKILAIGKLKRRYTAIRSIEAARLFVETYTEVLQGDDLLIGDLSLLSPQAQSVLLKFVEEKVENITCYASKDNISPVLMSRFDRIDINDRFKIGKEDFESFLHFIKEKDPNVRYDMNKEFVTKCAAHLSSYLLYNRLPKGVITRIGDLL